MKIPTRVDIVGALRERDGNTCQFPGCSKPFTDLNPPTIDHWFPQSYGFDNGWTLEQIWDLDNLKLMHKSCNAKKGNIVPNADGSLTMPVREPKVNKAERPELCDTCYSGRLLFPDELCEVCGSEAQPKSYPKSLQKKPKECDHSTYHCWMCVLGHVERKPAILRIIEGP